MKRIARRRLRLRGSAAATRLAQRLGRARATQRGILHAGMALRWRRAAIGRRRVPLTQVTRPLGSCAAPVHLHFGFAFEAAPRAGIARILCHASMERLNVTRALETRTWATRLVFAGQQERLGRASRASRARLPAEHAPGPVLRRAQDMTPSLAGRIARATGLAHGATRVARHRAAGPMTFLAPARRVVEDLHAAPAPALRLRRPAFRRNSCGARRRRRRTAETARHTKNRARCRVSRGPPPPWEPHIRRMRRSRRSARQPLRSIPRWSTVLPTT